MVEFSSNLSESPDDCAYTMAEVRMDEQPQGPTMVQLMNEIARLNEERNNLGPAPPTKRPRPALPDPEAFDGTQRTQYPQFRAKLQAKLSLDGRALGETSERLWYAYGCLSARAATLILPWMSIHA